MKITARLENFLQERELDTTSLGQTKPQYGALEFVGEWFGSNIG